MDKWIKLQSDIYAGKNFGEPEQVVNLKLKAYQKIFEYLKPGDKFLDLGCNSGHITFLVKEKGYEVLGVDLPEVINKIKYDIPKIALNLEQQLPNDKYGVIFIREVIEHLRNYEEVCPKIINLLSNSGTLIITAPNNKMDGPAINKQHIRIFENKELDKLVENSGGIIIEAFNERRQRVVIARKKS